MWLRSIGCILLGCMFLVVCRSGLASPAAPVQSFYSPVIEVLEDPTHLLTADSILLQPATRWQRIEHAIPSFGFSRSVYWARFAHDNPARQPEQLYVEVGYPLLNDVTLYQWHGNVPVLAQNIGNQFPFPDRAIQHRNLLFPITVPAQGNDTFYLRIASNSALQFPITLWQRDAFHAQDQLSIYQQGAYYGLVFVMVLYNFFLFWQFRDKVYLLYVLYVSAFSLMQMALTGFAYQWLWPNSPEWNQISIALLSSASVAFGCVFVGQALKLQQNAPQLYKIVNALAVAGMMLTAAGMLFPYHVMIKLVATLVIISCSFAFYTSYYMWLREKQRFAAYFSVAWTVYLIGVVCLALNKFGIIPRTFITESAAQIGSALEVILLSYALAERFRANNRLRLEAEREARLANEKILEVQQEITANLEQQFKVKTRELHEALEKVQLLNTELTEISHTDQLTGARNRRFMDAFLVREIKRANRYRRPLSLIMIDVDHFKSVNDRYGHPVGDLCLKRVTQMILSQLRRCHDEVCRYGGEEMLVILPDTPLHGALQHAERIRAAVESMLIDSGSVQFRVTISLGVASTEIEKLQEPLALTTAADQALYQAKCAGRNRVRVYEKRSNVHWLYKKSD